MTLAQLRRVRWAVRAPLALGVAASVVANVLHARHKFVSEGIAAWPPLALLLTIELISRVPVHHRLLAVVRMLATAAIACIAAWVSYWHMVSVCARFGESPTSSHLIPFSVDGVVVVASVCLVEIAGRLRAALDAVPVPDAPPTPVPAPEPADSGPDVRADIVTNIRRTPSGHRAGPASRIPQRPPAGCVSGTRTCRPRTSPAGSASPTARSAGT